MEEFDLPIFLDDNVLDPISRRGQGAVYRQLGELLASIEPEFKKNKGFDPHYTIESFFERLGKEGDFWTDLDIYQGISISREVFDDLELLAAEIGKIQKQIEKNIRNATFFKKSNLKDLYQKARQTYVGNNSAAELLNLTFFRYGNHLFSPNVDHWPLIIPDLVWDRLVAFPVAWKEPNGIHGVTEPDAKKAWECADKFYNCLLATYHSQHLDLFGAPFTRLLLQRYFVLCVLALKTLKDQVKKSRKRAGIIYRYRMQKIEVWVDKYHLLFKKNSDLVDVKLLHCALYGFVRIIENKKIIIPGLCITCDPASVVEKRLFLSVGAHKALTDRVDGWNLPLCPGKIICLEYKDSKFSHVKTIDVQKFFDEYCSPKKKWAGFKFKTRLFSMIVLDWLKVSVRTKLRFCKS